jgi:hypothetical protein
MSNTVLDKKIVHSHNKKRNIGLIYEFLIRNLTHNIIENNTSTATKTLGVLKKHFNKDSELYKEFRLVHSLFVTTVSNESVAANIIAEARNVALTHNVKKINKEKSLLIKDINYNINNESFYKQNVDNYKMYATLHNAIKCWRTSSADNFEKLAKYENQIAEWLVTKKDTQQLQNESFDDANNFVVKLMSKKIQEKYTNTFSKKQNVLLNEYVFAGTDEHKKQVLLSKFNLIKETALDLIQQYVSNNPNDSYVNDKLTVVVEKIQNNHSLLNTPTLNLMLVLTKLNDELNNK